MSIMGEWYNDYPPIILGTFGLQLGYQATWALDSSWRSAAALNTYSVALLAKIESRFLTALSNVSNVHLYSCPLMRFCNLNLERWRWIPFMFTCSVCTPQQMRTTHHKGCNGSQVLINLCTFKLCTMTFQISIGGIIKFSLCHAKGFNALRVRILQFEPVKVCISDSHCSKPPQYLDWRSRWLCV